jgi:ribosomal protein S18 acetylase RimI-like enzyme
MNHIAQIQTEFMKEARQWNKLSLEDQRSYLKRHPKSKRKLTGRSKSNTTKNDVRVKLEGSRIYHDGKEVGTLIFESEKISKKKFDEYWGTPEIAVWAKKRKIPHKFSYSYVDEIAVDKEHRGKGFARAAMNELMKPNSIVALEIGSFGRHNISRDRMKEKDRLKFYKALGFDFVKVMGDGVTLPKGSVLYGLKYTK